MDNNVVEESYKKFQKSLCQYLSKPIKDFASIKPQILQILQTHRPIRCFDYEYGTSKAGKKRCQLIIHEFNDRSIVREYFKSGMNVWRCCECNRTAASHDSTLTNDILIEHGIVFVKSEHDCKPRQHLFVLNVQKLYNEGKFDEANSLQKSVLGSEDSNVILKQKKAVSRKTNSRCLNGAKEVGADVSLQYVQEKDNDVQDHHRSFMDEDFYVIREALPPEDAFKEIIENLKEYTNEKAEVVLLKKSKILSLLKAHRPVKMDDYFFGLSQECKINRRLIVFEWNNRKGVREYTKRNDSVNSWRCLECNKLWYKHRRHGEEEHELSWLHSVCDIMFVQIKHDCLPRSYRLVIQYQKFLEDGDTSKAISLAQNNDFTLDECSFANTLNVIDDSCSSKSGNRTSVEKRKAVYESESNTETLTNLKRKIQSDMVNGDISFDDKPPLHKKLKFNKSTSEDTVEDENGAALGEEGISLAKISKRNKNKLECEEEPSTFEINNSILINDESQNNNKISQLRKKKKNSCDEEDVSVVHQKSEAGVEMEEKPIPTTFAFVKPSTSKLEEICTKLKIQYRNKVTKLWDKIIFEHIDTVSMPTDIQTHKFKTENFYEILSKLFTGKSTQHEQIRETIIEAFRQKLVVDLSEISSKKFDKLYSNKNNTVTDRLFSFIARFMKCRILIIDGKEMKKYGKWNSRLSNRLTLVLSLSDGLYSIVLNL